MSALPNADCTGFNRAISPELRADLMAALSLASRHPMDDAIIPVMQRVARAAAAERVRPEVMLVCVKELWLERTDPTSVRLPADGTWYAMVRAMVEAYYLGVDSRGEPRNTP